MRLTLRLLLPAEEVRHELVVTCPPGTTLASLRTVLEPHLPTTDGAPHVGGNPVPDAALLGRPPLLDGATLRFTHLPQRPFALAVLRGHVQSGPDTGAVFDLPPGEHLVGRSPEASIRLGDTAVSRAHAVLDVRTREVTARDAGSTNGTLLGDTPVGAHPVLLDVGRPLRLGGTTLVLHRPQEPPAAVRPDGEGHLLVNRSPQLPAGPADDTVEFPSPPAESTPARLSWLAAGLPLAFSAVLAAVLRSPTMLLFGLMSPVLLIGQWLGDRRGSRRSRRAALQAYSGALAAAEDHLAAALDRERAARHEVDPDPSLVLAIARQPQARLWERSASAGLHARVGVGRVPATTGCPGRAAPHVDSVPIDVDLCGAGGLAIAGQRPAVLASARALLGRTATFYSPRELRVLVVARPGHRPDWAWASGLPHCEPGDEDGQAALDTMAAALAERSAGPAPGGGSGPRLLVVLDGAAGWRAHPGLADALARGPALGVHVLSLDDEVSRLPAECRTLLDLTSDPPTLRRGDAAGAVAVTVDAVGPRWADHLTEALTPLRDAAPATSAGRLPDTVSLLDLLGLRDVSPHELACRWQEHPRSTSFPLGAGADGPVTVDLERDGPHVLVGGTTGSGKSELLLCLVAALAAANRPDEMSFVLVDYKGGAAFAGCAALPHVVGLVTDLDAELTRRALVSLDAELKRRERLLGEHGCRDLTAYLAAKRPHDPPLPRLVLVVDEFRSLAQDLPEFVAGLVRVASLGRSLGISLVVATQRPAGVVTADMRANLGLRIGLRMRDALDSVDVLEAPDAARILARTPGRALLRSAARELTSFQCALVTGCSPAREEVTLVSLDGVSLATAQKHDSTDLARLVEAATGAARRLAVPPVPSPWLPPLPAVVPVEDLAGSPGTVALGLADDPAQQAQVPYCWDFAAGPLAVVGPPRTGRTAALVTVAARLALDQADVDVYAVSTGELETLEAMACVGAAVDLTDLSRLDRLLSLLARTPSPEEVPRVLLVDDWDTVVEALQDARQPALLDALVALIRRGHRHGLRAVVTGCRLGGPLTGAFGQRLLLQPVDPVELAMAGVPARAACRTAPPGRAIDVGSQLQVQLALVTGTAALGPDAAVRGGKAGPEDAPRRRLPPAVPRLPVSVSREDLAPADDLVTVGVGPDGPVGFRPGRGQRRVAILGGDGSGRTTALATLARSLARLGHPVAVLSPTGTEPVADVTCLSADEVDRLVALRQQAPALALLVDDAEQLAGTVAEPVVIEIARLADQDRGFVAAATNAREVLQHPRGLTGSLAVSGCGLLLGRPSASDALALGLRGLVPHAGTAGRAHLVRGGTAEVVQLAR